MRNLDKTTVDFYESNIHDLGLWESEVIVFNKFVNKKSSILDIGCGTGRTTINLYKLGYKNIIGLDCSLEMLKYFEWNINKENCDIEFICQDITKNKLNIKKKFDCIFFSYNGLMTIFGSEKRKKALKNINNLLSDDGIFIFTSYDRKLNKKYYIYWLIQKIKWLLKINDKRLEVYGDRFCKKSSTGDYIYVPIKKELKSLLNECNFEIIFSDLRSNICNENSKVKKNTDDCLFYVCKKVK